MNICPDISKIILPSGRQRSSLLPTLLRDRHDPRDWRRIWRDPAGMFGCCCKCASGVGYYKFTFPTRQNNDCTNCSFASGLVFGLTPVACCTWENCVTVKDFGCPDDPTTFDIYASLVLRGDTMRLTISTARLGVVTYVLDAASWNCNGDNVMSLDTQFGTGCTFTSETLTVSACDFTVCEGLYYAVPVSCCPNPIPANLMLTLFDLTEFGEGTCGPGIVGTKIPISFVPGPTTFPSCAGAAPITVNNAWVGIVEGTWCGTLNAAMWCAGDTIGNWQSVIWWSGGCASFANGCFTSTLQDDGPIKPPPTCDPLLLTFSYGFSTLLGFGTCGSTIDGCNGSDCLLGWEVTEA